MRASSRRATGGAPRGGAGAWIARERLLLALVATTAALDSLASIIRHVHLGSGLDLAIFDQAVWHYSRLEAPLSSIKGENLLGDHFHPLLVVLAPLYWAWSDPRMLLIAQSALVAASVIPVFLFAQARLGRTGGYLVAGAYAAFWGLQVGVVYEFHEVAFAPLLIALAILFAERRGWGRLWLIVALLLCVKEDLSIFVIFLGIYLLSRREVRHGVALMAAGIAWYELATRVFIPHFAGGVGFSYWTFGELGRNLPEAVWALVRAPWRLATIGFSPAVKTQTIVALLAPFLFLSLGSRVFIIAAPLLAERFLSTNPQFWSTHFHYSMAIAPVLAMGAAADEVVLSHIAERQRFHTIGPRAVGLDEYIVTEVVDPTCCGLTADGSFAVRDSAVDMDLRNTTPIFYAAGWLVGRRPQRGTTPTNGVLAPMSPASTRSVATVAAGWFQQLFAIYGAACAEHDPRAVLGCFAAEVAKFTAIQARLSAAIHTALPALRGGCAELAAAALAATERLSGDLSASARAAVSGDRRATASTSAATQSDENDLDLSGALQRFGLLCTPRTAATG